MTESGRYLYAIARGISSADLAGATGMQDAPLRVLEHRGLAAIVSAVGLDEFGENGLREHLEDLEWLERVARTHDAVVRAATAVAATAPLRLATICLDDDGVRARLDEWHDALQATLGRIEGRMEWSVKAFTDPTGVPHPPGSQDTPGSGTAYLRRRKAETVQREAAAEEDAALAERLHAQLSTHAVASRRLAPQDRRITGHRGTMTLNGAYLVDLEAGDRFRAAVEQLSAEHQEARIEVEGPWPPYSFATLDEA